MSPSSHFGQRSRILNAELERGRQKLRFLLAKVAPDLQPGTPPKQHFL